MDTILSAYLLAALELLARNAGPAEFDLLVATMRKLLNLPLSEHHISLLAPPDSAENEG